MTMNHLMRAAAREATDADLHAFAVALLALAPAGAAPSTREAPK